MSHLVPLLRRFAKDESGVFAVLFGLMAVVLIALGGATVDYVSLEQTRQRAQVALDAAALALQPEIYETGITEEILRQRAEAIVLERIGEINVLEAEVTGAVVDLDAGKLTLNGHFILPTMFVSLVGVNELGATFSSEAVRGSVDIEVSVALDVTGSMLGSRIDDLKDATEDLIADIVQDVQEPNYTKIALAPYSQAVNAGPYAEALRGPIRGPKDITSMSWAVGETKTITDATRDDPVEITAPDHGFEDGDWVYIWDVDRDSMRQINRKVFKVDDADEDTFKLRHPNNNWVDGDNYDSFDDTAKVVQCLAANCKTVITAFSHGFENGDYTYVRDVGGLSGINNNVFRVTDATVDTLVLDDYSMIGQGTYSPNTGKLHCTEQDALSGCDYYRFNRLSGGYGLHGITTCVTERSGASAFTDDAPSVSFVGRNYPGSNGCLANQIVPLTSNKGTLNDAVDDLVAEGSTSGSLGILWSWYLLSPEFGYVWPEESRPAPYTQERLLKVAIIMTDGEFNTVHHDGVIARNTTSGSGGNSEKINEYAHNGDPYDQSEAYCDAMKATGIEVYTVAFGIAAGTNAANIMSYCASNPDNAFLASDGQALRDAFEQIARNISALRLTR